MCRIEMRIHILSAYSIFRGFHCITRIIKCSRCSKRKLVTKHCTTCSDCSQRGENDLSEFIRDMSNALRIIEESELRKDFVLLYCAASRRDNQSGPT